MLIETNDFLEKIKKLGISNDVLNYFITILMENELVSNSLLNESSAAYFEIDVVMDTLKIILLPAKVPVNSSDAFIHTDLFKVLKRISN